MGQTSWKGIISTAWNNTLNWTAGVPTATSDVIIGDANFTGLFQPTVNAVATCKSLTIGAGTRSPVLTQSSALTVANNLTINSDGSLSQGNTTLTLNGNWNNAGSFTTTNNGATVIFAGTTSETIDGTATTPFRRLTVNAGSTVTLNTNISVTTAFVMNGTFIPAENATPYLVSGAATLTLGASSILNVNAATFAANYGLTGTITLQAGCTVDYSATLVNQTIKQNLTYSTLKISGTGIKIPAGNLNALNATSAATGNINVSAATLDLSSFTANRGTTVTGGTLTVANGAVLKIGGTNTLPSNYNTRTLGSTSTVEYNGTTQAISAATSYGNLTISTAGTKTASAVLHILGNFSLTNGTFVPGSFSDTLEGNWNMTSGTFTNTGSTIVFNGSSTQDIFSTGAFNNLTVKKTTYPVTLSSNITVNGILNFIIGKIQTGGSNSVILPATGSVSGALQSTGWVYGKLQKDIATGSNVSRVFEIGDNASYTPATLLFASVTTAGNINAVVGTPDHPGLGTSGIDPTRSVNRYWSFTNSATVFTTASATVNWVAADVDAEAVTANFKAGNYNGATWSLPTVASPLSTSIHATGLSALGDLAIGYPTGVTWTGAVSTDWYLTGNWSSNFVPLNTSNVTIPSGLIRYPLISTGTATTKNITIQSGASLTVSGSTLQIAGSISNSGTFTTSNGTVELNGSTAQVIPAGAFTGNTIKNLTINNTANVTLNGTLQLSGILKATTGQLTTGGYLTLLSTAAQTALIDGSGAGEVIGNVTMQRYLASGFGYKYFSSPFQAATVNEFSNELDLAAAFPTFYTYTEDRNYSGWTTYTSTTGSLTPMLGYAANFGTATAPVTVDMTGVVNNHTVTSPALYNHNQPYTLGFNLAGNPYPSPVDWDAAGGWTRTNIDNAVYYFNAGTTSQFTGSYSSYINGISSDGIANNIIPAMQGFFIHVSDGTYPVAATLSINNNARTNNFTTAFHRRAMPPLLRLNTSFADEGSPEDAVVIYFDDTATPAFNQATDALKMMNTDPQIPNLYLLSKDAAKLSIRSLPYLHDSASVQLGLASKKTGCITFTVQDMEQMPYGLHIYLRDVTTGILQDLQRNPHYRVQLEAGKYEQRFSLVFSEKELVNQQTKNETVNIYSAGGKVSVYQDLAPGEKGYITISNISGQVILRQEISGNGYHHLQPVFSSGVYIVSCHSQKGLRSKKIFIGYE
ncbi:hypothetical protein GCM10022209_25830 [Chitinophaga oryziterrae]